MSVRQERSEQSVVDAARETLDLLLGHERGRVVVAAESDDAVTVGGGEPKLVVRLARVFPPARDLDRLASKGLLHGECPFHSLPSREVVSDATTLVTLVRAVKPG